MELRWDIPTKRARRQFRHTASTYHQYVPVLDRSRPIMSAQSQLQDCHRSRCLCLARILEQSPAQARDKALYIGDSVILQYRCKAIWYSMHACPSMWCVEILLRRLGRCCNVVATTKNCFVCFTANPGHHFSLVWG